MTVKNGEMLPPENGMGCTRPMYCLRQRSRQTHASRANVPLWSNREGDYANGMEPAPGRRCTHRSLGVPRMVSDLTG